MDHADRTKKTETIPTTPNGEEIDLVGLLSLVIKRKYILLFSVFAVGITASIYAFSVDPVYRAEIHLTLPHVNDVKELYVAGAGLGENSYTAETVFNTFIDTLWSQGFRRAYFNRHQLVDYYAPEEKSNDENASNVFYDKFTNNLSIVADESRPSYISIIFRGSDPEWIAQTLNQFIADANRYAVQRLISDLDAATETRISLVRQQIEEKLAVARQRKRDDLVRLQEAIEIAKALGIKDGTVEVLFSAANDKLALSRVSANHLLYMRGEKALSKEVEVLRSRKLDESFADELPELQARLAKLSLISVDSGEVSAVVIDQKALAPYRAEKPHKAKIIIFGLFGGLLVGICMVLLAEFLSRVKMDRM